MHLREEEKLIIKEWMKQDPQITVPAVCARVAHEFRRSVSCPTIRRLLRAFGANLRTHTTLTDAERLIIQEWIKQDPKITRDALHQKIKVEFGKNLFGKTLRIIRKTFGANVRAYIALTDAEKSTVQKWIEQNPNIDKKLLRQKIQNELGRTVSESTVGRLFRKVKTILNSTH